MLRAPEPRSPAAADTGADRCVRDICWRTPPPPVVSGTAHSPSGGVVVAMKASLGCPAFHNHTHERELHMYRLLVAGCLMSGIAMAADPAPQMTEQSYEKLGWTPRKVTKEDKKGVEMTLDSMHKGFQEGNLQTVMSNVDFPVLMVTDDKAGTPMSMMVDASGWEKMMSQNMKAMAEDKELAALMNKMPKPKHDIVFLTDSLAMVTTKHQSPLGKGKIETRSGTLMVNKGGKWMVKTMVEGGWGDSHKQMMMGQQHMDHQMKPAASSGATPPKG
jgi:hypothetical protein